MSEMTGAATVVGLLLILSVVGIYASGWRWTR